MNRKLLIAAVITSLFTAAVYIPSLHNGFVDWDDLIFVRDNHNIREINTELFRSAFFDFYEDYWMPLTWISYAVDYQIWGTSPFGYHLTNIIIHALNVFLLTFLAGRVITVYNRNINNIYQGRVIVFACVAAGLIFGVHPLRVESVTWIAERKDVLSICFALASLILYIEYASGKIENPNNSASYFSDKKYIFTLLFFMMALISKPNTVTLPVVLLIIDWFLVNRLKDKADRREALIEKTPFFLCSIIVGIIIMTAQKSVLMSWEDSPLWGRILLANKSIVSYLRMMFWPAGLIPFYVYPHDISILKPEYIISIFFVLLITAIVILKAKTQRLWLAAWLYFLVTLGPMLGITQSSSQAMADRYTYFPSVGISIIAGAGFGMLYHKAVQSREIRNTLMLSSYAFFTALIVVYLVLNINLQSVWYSTETLWSRVIDVQPMKTGAAYYARGSYYVEKGEYKRALQDINTSIEIARQKNHKHIDMNYFMRGEIYAAVGNYQDATNDYSRAINISPQKSEYYYKRGMILQLAGRTEEAKLDFMRSRYLDRR